MAMTDKQMEEKKKEFRELEVQLYREMKENAKVTGIHDLDELDEKKWQWIEKLVEEVEDRDRKLLEEVANSDYELGKMQGIIEAKEHEQHRKKIRKELLRRYN